MNRATHSPQPLSLAVPVRVLRDGSVVATFDLAAPAIIVLGRQADCAVRLDADLVSRHHARLVLGPEFFALEDLSANGTLLPSGDVVHRARRDLPYGTALGVGPFMVEVGR